MADYVPDNDAEFDDWFKFMNQYVTLKCTGATPEWTHIPPAARTIQTDAYAAWYTAYGRTKGPHTLVDTAAKNAAKKAAKALIHPFVNQYLRFPPVTDEDRLAMNIPNHDSHPSPIPVPGRGPVFSIVQVGPGMLGIIYRNGETGKKGSKPKGVVAVRVYYGVSDEPITDQERLPGSQKATKCGHVTRFRESDRGKRAYFACKWELSKEDSESPWSEIQSEIIP
jgi:hypothetical protein